MGVDADMRAQVGLGSAPRAPLITSYFNGDRDRSSSCFLAAEMRWKSENEGRQTSGLVQFLRHNTGSETTLTPNPLRLNGVGLS